MRKIDQISKLADNLFASRHTMMSYWQEVAEQVYPERADFTSCRYIGEDFASNMATSYPMLARREFCEVLSGMMRPRNKRWFRPTVRGLDEEKLDHESKVWLEKAGDIMWAVMYDPKTKFVRASKETDHDFGTFGNAVLSANIDTKTNRPLYRNWHLRDVAWIEDYDGEVREAYRKSKRSALQLVSEFGIENVSADVKRAYEKNPIEEFTVYHACMPADRYQSDEKKFGSPYVSISFEKDSRQVLRESGATHMIYIIPRWQLVSGFQYAYSPAAVSALPDSRLIQAMALSIMESGEMATQPPMFARSDVFRGDVNRIAAGISFLDLEPEQRIGDAIEFQPVDSRGIAMANQLMLQIQDQIAKAWYLDKIRMPQAGPDMTAYEVSQRISENIRQNMPLFEPLEQDYNYPICSTTFEMLLANGGFGPQTEIPDQLLGKDIEFAFESPLHEAIERQKGQVLLEGAALVGQMAALDPSVSQLIKAKPATKDALEGIGYDVEWIASEEEMKQSEEMAAQQAEAQQAIQLLQAGGDAAKAAGEGAQSLSAGGLV